MVIRRNIIGKLSFAENILFVIHYDSGVENRIVNKVANGKTWAKRHQGSWKAIFTWKPTEGAQPASQAEPQPGLPEVHLSGRVLRAQTNPFPSVTVYLAGAGSVWSMSYNMHVGDPLNPP